jgi:hypothetical protein
MSNKLVSILRHAMESSVAVGVGWCVAEGSVECDRCGDLERWY